MKTLILFYSYGGNTKKIAQMMQQEIGGDLVEIETVKPYVGSYNDIVNQGQEEVESGFMPEIKPLTVNLSEYDRIILGSPVWWYTFAPAMKTFLTTTDLSGKQIYPYATNGGWIGHTFKDFAKSCSGASLHDGINIRFDKNTLRTSISDIKKWLQKIK